MFSSGLPTVIARQFAARMPAIQILDQDASGLEAIENSVRVLHTRHTKLVCGG